MGYADSESMGTWFESKRTQSSTWRELEALVRVVMTFESRLQGRSVRWYIDNKNAMRIVKAGSGNPELQRKAMRIQGICEEKNVNIDPVWIPRNENKSRWTQQSR